jgi:predicted Fe-S protein YdhL (DUF1289 family)
MLQVYRNVESHGLKKVSDAAWSLMALTQRAQVMNYCNGRHSKNERTGTQKKLRK